MGTPSFTGVAETPYISTDHLLQNEMVHLPDGCQRMIRRPVGAQALTLLTEHI